MALSIINRPNVARHIKKEVDSCVEKVIKDELEEKIDTQNLFERWHCPNTVIQNYIKRGLLNPKKNGKCTMFKLKDIMELEDEGLAKRYK